MKFFPKVISILTIVSFLPLSASAATNQEVIDAALDRIDNEGSIMHMNASVHVSDRDLFNREVSSGDVELQVKTKTRPTTDPNITDSDGRFTLSKFTLASSEAGLFSPLELDAPLVIEWVNRHPMKYIRLQQVPESVANFFKIFGANILGIQKTWIGFEWEEETFGTALSMNDDFAGIDSALDITATNGVDASALMVTGVERTSQNANGELITRYRAKLNPAYINEVHQNKINAAETELERELANTALEEQFRIAESLGFAINYNNATSRIERIEMGGKVTEPRKGGNCEFIGNEFVCETVGTTVTTYSVGMTYFPDDLRPIHHPPGWRWFTDIADRLELQGSESEDALMELLSDAIGR